MGQHETSLSEQEVEAFWDRLEGMAEDRRRPGRPNHISPHLIPLLRGEAAPSPPPSCEIDLSHDQTNLKPAFRIPVFGITVGMILWAFIGFASWALLH